MKTTKRIFSVTLVLCMLVGTIGVLPVSVFATGTCTCESRCYLNEIDANCTVCTELDYSDCMGTPELVENGSPWRLSNSTAEVNFMANVNPNVTWKYFYIVTNDATAQPTASEIIAGGVSGNYSDPCTLLLDNLAEGEKYIHIVLNQAEQGRTTNVLRLTIPAFVELTLTPSANGGNYDANTNTLTIEGGGTVNFTLNMPGYVHCDNDETIEATPVGDDPENATEWTVTLSATPKTYTFYYGLGGQEAWCTVVVIEEETHQHSYSSSWSSDASGHWHSCSCGATSDFAEHTSSGAATEDAAEICTVCDYEISPKLTHTHNYGTLKYDADNHWYECSCGDKSEVTAHSGGTATCTEKAKCSVCSQSYGNLKDHSYSSSWSSDASGHWHKCSCGATSAFAEHTSSGAATEDEAEVCTVCGYELAPALGHQHTHSTEWWKDEHGHWHGCECGDMPDFAEHISSGAASYGIPETCTICGYEIAPAKTTYTLTLVMGNETIGGDLAALETKQYDFAPGTIVDLTDYWTSAMEYTVNGQTYYFSEFWEHKTGGNTVRSVTISADLTVYAGWVKRKQITITFDPNGGSLPYEKVREFSDSFSKMNEWHIPTRDGYTFLGWSVWPEGPADRPDRIVKNDCTLYAIWAEGIVIKGCEDAVLVDKNGTIEKVEDGYTAIFNDSRVDMNNSAWQSLIDQLQDGEQLKIATEQLAVTPLTDGIVVFDEGVLTGAVIFTKEELLDLKVIEEDNGDITWNELKYLYHHMTTEELKSLSLNIKHFHKDRVDPQVLVWIAEMIERDSVTTDMKDEYLKWGMYLTDDQVEQLKCGPDRIPSIGQIRNVELSLDNLNRLNTLARHNYKNIQDPALKASYEELMAWVQEAISAKRWRPSEPETYLADATKKIVLGAVNVDFDAVKVNGTTGAVSESRPITASGELAYTIAVSPAFDLSKGTVRAYKVMDDGSLSLRKAVVNADGTVTIQSDSNSTYIVTYEEHTHSFEWVIDKEATETEDGIKHEECACGAKQNENTVIPKTGTGNLVPEPEVPGGLSTGAIVAIVIACVIVLAGGGFAIWWFVFKKKKA